jgi:transcriptional regulator GlxA family with amidase domain
MRRRVERAQGLMLTTNISLARIAVTCGIADQAQFNILFRRFVGVTPGTWRRARMAGPESSSQAMRSHPSEN